MKSTSVPRFGFRRFAAEPCTPGSIQRIPKDRLPKRGPLSMICGFAAALACAGTILLAGAAADEVENAKEVTGFIGQVTGTVKSVQPDSPSFVLIVAAAEVDSAMSTLKESAPLLGREITLGVRMPKTPDGVSHPHPEDTAYVKTLQPGMVITVKIFAPRSNPRVLRLREPGRSAASASEPPPKAKPD